MVLAVHNYAVHIEKKSFRHLHMIPGQRKSARRGRRALFAVLCASDYPNATTLTFGRSANSVAFRALLSGVVTT